MIYLACAYTHDNPNTVAERVENARKAMAHLINKGQHVYCPIVQFHEVALNYNLPGDFIFWQKLNFDMIDRCDEVVVLTLDGWQDSIGVNGEIDYAERNHKPVTYMALPNG